MPPALIESIYEAALDHMMMGRMLETVSEAIRRTQAIITQYDGGALHPVGIAGVAGNFDAGAARIMMEQHQHNLWTDAMTAEEGTAGVLDGPVRFRALQRTGFYVDVLRPTDLAHGYGHRSASRRRPLPQIRSRAGPERRNLRAGGSRAVRGLRRASPPRQRIFAKIGISRRGELIRLCAALPR